MGHGWVSGVFRRAGRSLPGTSPAAGTTRKIARDGDHPGLTDQAPGTPTATGG